jgi:RNA polymerase sigma-70 factor (ECF subfamily)
MSNRASDKVLRELAFLAALDSVQAKVDTSVIPEIQDWSGAVVGEFYGATVKQLLPAANRPSAGTPQPVAVNVPLSAPHITFSRMEYAQATDPQLISTLFQDDVAGWQEFVRRFQPLIARMIVKIARRMGNVSYQLLDDLVQDVFVKLCINDFQVLKRINLQQEQAIPGFLKVLAANVAQDYFRSAASLKRGAALEKEELREDSLPMASDPAAMEKRILFGEIDRLLQSFAERDRTIFWLYYRSGLTAKGISQMQGGKLTEKGVESLLWRMTRQIREALASPVRKEKKRTES